MPDILDGLRHEAHFADVDPIVYFDLLEPASEPTRAPFVMVHGGAHSGMCYRRTPDGRPGWAPFFAARGHRVFTPDWPGSGRSGSVPIEALNGERVCRGLAAVIAGLDEPVILMTHSMSGAYGWKLLETHGDMIRALVAIAPGPPGNIQPAANIVARDETMVDVERFGLRWKIPLNAPFAATPGLVHDKLIGGSRRFPTHAIDAYTASLQSIAPRLLYERQNVDGSQLRVGDTSQFRNKPVLIVTGSDNTDHAREVDGEVADWLSGLGAAVDYRFLPDSGIDGNGHMLMLEDNSDEIAALIGDWIEKI